MLGVPWKLEIGGWELTVLSSRPLTSTSDDARRAAVIARVNRRIIPFAFICYVVAYIDRVNIGFAARELQHDLGLSATEYGLGAGLFFLGYCLFEIPSNLILERVGARRWIARIMIGWGIVSMATMFISDVTSFMIARVVLGIAEAGFFPGMVLYLTYWVPAAERARTNALFMMAAPVSVIIGAPVSEAILRMNGMFGLRGWQWLFLLEGLPAVMLGFLALRVLTDRPEQADWLPADDREWLSATMSAERAQRHADGARRRAEQPGKRPRLAADARLPAEHVGHLRHLPVAAADAAGHRRPGRLGQPATRRFRSWRHWSAWC